MTKIAPDAASRVETMERFEGRYEDLGGYTVGFERYSADDDPSPLFAGLPDDACQCPHWGVVEFSPTAELQRTMEVVIRNVAAMQAG